MRESDKHGHFLSCFQCGHILEDGEAVRIAARTAFEPVARWNLLHEMSPPQYPCED